MSKTSMNKERLVLLGPVYPYKGGIAHYTSLMCKALREKYEVKMISYSMQYPKILFKKEQKDYSSDSFKVPNTHFVINTANPLNWLKYGVKIANLKPKAVIIQWWHPYFAPCYITLASILKAKGIPVLFICHNVFPHERFPMDRLLAKLTLKLGSRYIVQSKQDEEDLLGIIPDAIHTLTPHPTYNAFKIKDMSRAEARAELGLSEETPVMLFFGFVREYKGLNYLLDALPDILKELPDAKLYVVGDFGEDKDKYMQQIEKNGVKDAIIIRDGYVPDGEVEPYFAACDLSVLPYVSATQSGIVQISYGFEKPCVVTNVGGLPEVVVDGATGYVVESQNPKAIAEAVVKFFKENKAQEFAVHIEEEKRKYSWEVMEEKITALLNK